MIKDIWKGIALLITGLIAVVVIYPFFHEVGHILFAWIVGAKVKQVSFFPIPSVLCCVRGVSSFNRVIIAFGGMVLPILFSIIIPRRYFIIWYAKFIIQSVCLLSFVISFVSVITDMNIYDDMVRIGYIDMYEEGFLLIVLIILSCFMIMIIIRDKPLERIYKYFQIEKRSSKTKN